ncbi:Peptidase M23 [uncultured Caudovirales phage]|uniref:Peptidase M23 n=1 Tax=uncultured Caudovirales phage TaxID=2100421 RepID=A0A6J5PGU7_9CAUD|nr:Peptidase M23 [uncultured Caudovirales phage]CAB4180086.1 Peptidase M23 [uncultured Caudovirales phage]CAB4222131.1 Peptidase M23 [uncultured Caudovirales phage]
MKPIKLGVITFPYMAKYRNGTRHKGVDYRASIGTPVQACVGGVVVHAGRHIYKKGWGLSFGIHCIVDNDRFPDGTAGLWAGYCHLQAVGVHVGQRVAKGDLVGISGNTGNSTGPHLHLQILSQRTWNPTKIKNPQKWIDA